MDRILSFGHHSRIELEGSDNQHYEVTVTPDDLVRLNLSRGQRVQLRPIA